MILFPAEIGIFDIMELSASDIIAEYLDINAIRSILKQHKCPESDIVVYQLDRLLRLTVYGRIDNISAAILGIIHEPAVILVTHKAIHHFSKF